MNPNPIITRTGIRLGCAYTPPPLRDIGSEAEKVQTAMLRPHDPRGLIERVSDWFNARASIIMATIIVVGLVLGLTKPLWRQG